MYVCQKHLMFLQVSPSSGSVNVWDTNTSNDLLCRDVANPINLPDQLDPLIKQAICLYSCQLLLTPTRLGLATFVRDACHRTTDDPNLGQLHLGLLPQLCNRIPDLRSLHALRNALCDQIQLSWRKVRSHERKLAKAQ